MQDDNNRQELRSNITEMEGKEDVPNQVRLKNICAFHILIRILAKNIRLNFAKFHSKFIENIVCYLEVG